MPRVLFRPHIVSSRLGRAPLWRSTTAGFATEPYRHPNPGNFANRSKEEMSEIGRKGGRKGGQAKGVGGFHNMDPEKQHEIASRGGRATRKSAEQGAQYYGKASRRFGSAPRPNKPSAAAPGFEKSWTS
ncbi:KGG domain-containing protein [Aspergillus clavatus NRRL 1]|uniref:Conidiation-specific protein Con-10, putative n=1 Tax=Aspergillus clavatus (strain ATCC 1007 / CBS 513.65 / DSM 816 / NCTC 3887 / NRRL 1 / QM 1276 / 107) TaxID=344612 RepID=A1C4V1_ASPCL|nr:conidiation-specific protein Con-10, putative [Aspergillus clavatus NRRL 1]EAW14719.1 conidiation-specific protein Con-10, putative [Aspergillus clavatus NRRL 1]